MIKSLKKKPVKDGTFILSILILPLISFAIFYVFVNFNSFLLAFRKIDIAGEYSWVGLNNFKEFFTGTLANGAAWPSFLRSIKMWWTVTIINTPLQLIMAYYVAKKLPCTKFVSIVVMLPQVISSMVFALVYKEFVTYSLKEILVSWGVLDKAQPFDIFNDARLAYVNNLFYTIWVSFGTSTLLYSNAIRAISGEIFESAQLDGASDSREFFSIVLPLIWPTLSTTFVTNATSMFTFSGSLLVFYMGSAPENLWGLGYFFTKAVGISGVHDFMQYPAVATSGLVVSMFTVPVVFLIKFLMGMLDRTDN